MEIYDVVKKLVGEIEPVGSCEIDEKRFKHLLTMRGLVLNLIGDIHAVAGNKHRHEHSLRKAGQYAYDTMYEISTDYPEYQDGEK